MIGFWEAYRTSGLAAPIMVLSGHSVSLHTAYDHATSWNQLKIDVLWIHWHRLKSWTLDSIDQETILPLPLLIEPSTFGLSTARNVETMECWKVPKVPSCHLTFLIFDHSIDSMLLRLIERWPPLTFDLDWRLVDIVVTMVSSMHFLSHHATW